MNVSRLISERDNTTSKEIRLYENFEEFIITPGAREIDFSVVQAILNDLIVNKVADAVLYARLSQRLLVNIDDLEDTDTITESEIDSMQNVSEILEEHSEEEFGFFQDTLSLAMALNLACGMDYCTLPSAAGMKFSCFNEMTDFVQNRELKSLFKYYMLWQALVSTPVLAELEDEEQVHYINLVKEIIVNEIEHFEDLLGYSEVGDDDYTLSKIELIKKHMEKEI